MHHIQTVTGRLAASAVTGPALAHEHLALDLTRDSDPAAALGSAHAPAITDELRSLRAEFGLSLVIELTCRGMGRDATALARIARGAGVAVVAATGWYYEPFHPTEVGIRDVGSLTALLTDEITSGIGATGVRPGVIGEVGSHGDTPSPPEARALTAAGRAAAATGLSVATHAQLGRGGLAQLDLLTATGLDPRRVSVGHQDLLDDPATHRRLAEQGAYVAFDTVGKESYQSDTARLRLLLAMVEAGHADRALLSCDISRHGYLAHEGGQGYGHLFRVFLPRLRAAGVDEDTIDLITRRNPLRFLTGATVPDTDAGTRDGHRAAPPKEH